jgi:hypothetical protein
MNRASSPAQSMNNAAATSETDMGVQWQMKEDVVVPRFFDMFVGVLPVPFRANLAISMVIWERISPAEPQRGPFWAWLETCASERSIP